MKTLDTRRVLLAGIGEERLDLFLMLNEGAGYELTGVVESSDRSESGRIAEILGVRVYRDADVSSFPPSDLLIYGEPADRYRVLGEKLGLSPDRIWSEDEAWDILTRDANDEASERRERRPAAEPGAAPVSPAAPGGAGAPASAAAPGGAAAPAWAPAPENTGGAPAETVSPAASEYALLNAFARASGTLQSLYGWILDRAMAETKAAAGGIAPAEPIRPVVWRDRRTTPRGELPSFLRDEAKGEGVLVFALGDTGSPGAARLVLIGARKDDGASVSRFVTATAPQLRVVAELEDLRRQHAWDGVVQRLVSSLERATSPDTALSETAASLAETLGARECVLLFLSSDGTEFRGYSSRGERVSYPATSGLMSAATDHNRLLRLHDDDGAWHYHVPFGREGARGMMALFGVSAAPGAVESVGHQAYALAGALAPHLPEEIWKE